MRTSAQVHIYAHLYISTSPPYSCKHIYLLAHTFTLTQYKYT